MGQIVLYLAISVDGYLADERGGVGWLGGDGSEPDAPGSHPVFLETVDAIASVSTNEQDKPDTDVVIQSITFSTYTAAQDPAAASSATSAPAA